MDEEKLLQLASVVGKLKKKVSDLDSKADTIKKLQGPQGEQGLQGPKGDAGKDGLPGRDGKDGRDGVDGKDGKDGKPGVSVVDAYIDIDNSLVLKLSNGIEVSAGELPTDNKTKDNIYVQNTQNFSLDGYPVATTFPVPTYFLVQQQGEWRKAPFSYLNTWLSEVNYLVTESGDRMTTESGDYIIME